MGHHPAVFRKGRIVKYRQFGRIGWNISEVSFGAWAVGGSWGTVDDEQSIAAMKRALDLGVNFFDTADVYGDGRSERLIQRLRKETKTPFHVATKAGRRLNPHVASGYNKQNLSAFIERSLQDLGVDSLELVQLHCPPTDAYYQPETFEAMDDLVKSGKVQHYGVSVERVEEGLKAMDFPGVESVQIIFNMFRQRPAEHFLAEAKRRGVATIIRVPLASGMLTGKLTYQLDVRGGRSPKLQSPRRSLRRRGNLRRRALRGWAQGGGRAESAGSGVGDAGTIRASLDPDVRGRLYGNPRRQEREAS